MRFLRLFNFIPASPGLPPIRPCNEVAPVRLPSPPPIQVRRYAAPPGDEWLKARSVR